jgi:CheY-like chemotaxis protein
MNDKKRILIVEDDALTAFWIMTVLRDLGYYTFEPVDSGEKAIEDAAIHNPDFIIMDIWLAGTLNGIETAEKILSTCKTSIIFISGYPEDDFTTQCKQVSYTAFLNKPLEIYDLEKVLKTNI